MSSVGIAIAAALIGFVSSLTVLIFKEVFDRRRQRRAAINALSLMTASLGAGLAVQPEQIPHIHLEKMMTVLHDLATRKDLARAYAAYDAALREYMSAWAAGAAPTALRVDNIRTLLASVDAVFEKYADGPISRGLDRIAGIAD